MVIRTYSFDLVINIVFSALYVTLINLLRCDAMEEAKELLSYTSLLCC